MSQLDTELEVLLRADTLRLIDEIGALEPTADLTAVVTGLRRAGHSPETVAAAMTQARLRARARAKFGDIAAGLLLTEDGLQQATRLSVAAHHAQRFRAAGARRVADLGCGIGADALALAGLGLGVLAVERDPRTAAIAQYNLAAFGDVEVRIGDAETTPLDDVDGVWLDPARRAGAPSGRGPRRLGPEDWSPSLDFAFGLGERLPTGVKLGPGMDRELIPPGAEAQWVSVGGDVVELVVWRGGLERPEIRRAALVLPGDGGTGHAQEMTAADDSPDAPVGPLGEVLVEPDGAVIRARLIGELARRLASDARMLDATIAWITMSAPPAAGVLGRFGSAFAVEAELPLDARTIGRELRARGIGAIEIKKRGVDLDPAEFRRALRLDPKAARHGTGAGSPVLIATRVAGRRRAILARRLG